MEAIKVCEINDCICPHPLKCYAACASLKPKSSGPVRTVTRKEIVPGLYGPLGKLNIETRDDQSETYIDLLDGWYEAADIREFARLLNEIADAMESNDGR